MDEIIGNVTLETDMDISSALKKAKELHNEVKRIYDSRTGDESPALNNVALQMKKIEQSTQVVCDNIEKLQGQLDKVSVDRVSEMADKLMELSRLHEELKGDYESLSSAYNKKRNEMLKNLPAEYNGDTLSMYDLKNMALAAEGDEKQNMWKAYQESLKLFKEDLDSATVSVMGQTMSLADAKLNMDEVSASMQEVRQEIQPLGDELGLVASNYDNLSQLQDAVNDKVKEAAVAEQQLNTQLEAQTQALSNLNDQQTITVVKYEQMQQKASQPVSVGGGRGTGANAVSAEMRNAQQGVQGLMSAMRGLARFIPGVNAGLVMGLSRMTYGMNKLSKLTKTDIMNAITMVKNAIAGLFEFIMANPIVALIAAILFLVTKLFKLIKKGVEELKKNLEEIGKAVLSVLKTVGKAFTSMLKTALKGAAKLGTLLPVATYGIIKKLISLLKSMKSMFMENLGYMAKWNSGANAVNTALSNITSSVAYLKAALTTTIVPILVQVEPLITSITNRLAEMVTTVGMLIAKLTGASTFIKATRIQKDYAESLKKSSQNLASFDKLNVINQDDKSVDFDLVDLQETEIPNWFDDLEGLGRKVGIAVTNFLGNIPWNDFIDKASALGKSVADFLNGFNGVEGIGDAVGRAFGKIINTITTFSNNFLNTFDGLKFGKTIGDAITTALRTINAIDLGDMFSTSINKLSDMIIGFTTNFDGKLLGDKISQFFENALGDIDWNKIKLAVNGLITDFVGLLNGVITPQNFTLVTDTLNNTLDTIFGAIGTFANSAQWSQWANSISTGINNLFGDTDEWATRGENLSKFATNATQMLLNAIQQIDWGQVGDSLVAFISNIDWNKLAKNAVEISQKLREALQQIWTNLSNSDAFDEIIDLIADFLKEKKNWKKAFKKIKRKIFWEVLWERVKSGFENIGKYLLETLTAPFQNAIDLGKAAGEFFDNAVTAFQNQDWGQIGISIIEGIVAIFTSIASFVAAPFVSIFQWLYDGICAIFGINSPAKSMESVGENIILGILEGFGLVDFAKKMSEWWNENVAPWFSLEKWAEIAGNIWEGISGKIGELRDNLVEKFEGIRTNVEEIWQKVSDFIIGIWEGIKEGVKAPINAFLSAIEFLVNKVILGFNWMIDKLNALCIDIPDWVPGIGGRYLGFSIDKMSDVSIPRLAQGAVIPPNMSNFLAMLGDNNRETEIVSPLSTIEQALRNVLGEQNVHVTFQVEGDPNGIFKVVQKEAKSYNKRTGSYAFGG